MYFKTIIQGRLEFGTQRSFDKVTMMFNQRLESYYKTDVIFKFEDIFNEEDLSLEVPRYVAQITEKSFRATTGLLAYCAQFAVAGSIRAWLTDEGKILKFELMEPKSDKGVVQSYIKGRKLVKVKGKESEAIDALSKAIEKYNRHAQAYERRAKVNFMMKNYHDAKRDYDKCIKLDPTIPTAYYGKAKIHILSEEWQDAIDNLEESIKKSIALQTLYWKSRRLKSYCHIKLKEWDKAAFDLKLFTNRAFATDDPNRYWLRWSYYYYGIVLMEQENFVEALKAFTKASEMPEIKDGLTEADILTERGWAKKKAGKSGFVKDLKDAAAKGSTRAENLLEQISKRKSSK